MCKKSLITLGIVAGAFLAGEGKTAFASGHEEAESGRPVLEKQAVRKRLGREEVERKKKEIESKFRALARKRAQEVLSEIRGILEVSSDEQWAKLEGNLEKLMSLKQARLMCSRAGWMAAKLAKRTPGAPDEPYAGPLLSYLYPGVTTEAKEVKSLLDSQQNLFVLLRKQDASEEAFRDALSNYRAATKELGTSIRALQAALSKHLTPRQEAALVLAGHLD